MAALLPVRRNAVSAGLEARGLTGSAYSARALEDRRVFRFPHFRWHWALTGGCPPGMVVAIILNELNAAVSSGELFVQHFAVAVQASNLQILFHVNFCRCLREKPASLAGEIETPKQ